ncbi:MAG: alpha/beta fold hydrolase [Candidatus Lokiarchaeota archaeon]|nr:alpha/beta fold hydrolase [Candidatus Lokiarchaeota archaeon]
MPVPKEKAHSTYWHAYCPNMDPGKIQDVVEERWLVSAGTRIHLDVFGMAGENLPITVVFIPGTSVYSRFYASFLYGLYNRGFRVVCPDMPGHGLSGGPRGHFTIEQLVATVQDVVSWVLGEQGQRIVVMGSSLGGITAFYAAAADRRINATVCHNAAILSESAHKKIVKVSGIYKMMKPLVPALSRVFPRMRISVKAYLDPDALTGSADMRAMLDKLFVDPLFTENYTLTSLATQMKAKPAAPPESIETPVMLINGTDDVLFSVDYMREIHDRLARSHKKALEIIEGGTHFVLHEHRDACIGRIETWIRKVME